LNKFLAGLAVLAVGLPALAHAEASDPIGDLIGKLAAKVQPILATFGL
jgi:hypothetical protein